MKLKQGRFWFIVCRNPIPNQPTETRFMPSMRPLAYSIELGSKGAYRIRFHTSGKPREYGYYWSTENGQEVVWTNTQEKARKFNSREEAETRAFEVVTLAPWLIGYLEVMKLKVMRTE